jgi:hypothetical protein
MLPAPPESPTGAVLKPSVPANAETASTTSAPHTTNGNGTASSAASNFRSVLGLAPASPKISSAPLSPGSKNAESAPSSSTTKRKKTASRSVPADDAFFEVPDPKTPIVAEDNNLKGSLPSRRAPLRMDAQDGPWSISVADHPHDARSYTLYIKSKLFIIYCTSR